jgi:hypothetical protein
LSSSSALATRFDVFGAFVGDLLFLGFGLRGGYGPLSSWPLINSTSVLSAAFSSLVMVSIFAAMVLARDSSVLPEKVGQKGIGNRLSKWLNFSCVLDLNAD